jgi:hypothetical protein
MYADGNLLLPLAPCETLKIEQNRAMCGEGSCTPCTPWKASMSLRGKRLSNSLIGQGLSVRCNSRLGFLTLTFFPSRGTTALIGGQHEFIQTHRLGTSIARDD